MRANELQSCTPKLSEVGVTQRSAMQELAARCTAAQQEYAKSASMLLQCVSASKAKDTQIEKLQLANTRLQSLCRAVVGGKSTNGSVCEVPRPEDMPNK
jgi:hypothetical protein